MKIIIDNTQLTIFSGFAPNSNSTEILSKALGSRTVLSGSVSQSKNEPLQSLQMMEQSLMTSDELKSMKKGQFVVMKTGFHPMKVKLKLFFQWGIRFDENNPYIVKESGNRKVQYAEQPDIRTGVMRWYHSEILWMEKFYEDVEAEMKDVPFGDGPQKSKLQQSKERENRHQQSKKGTIRTAPRRKNSRGAKQVITDTEKERSVEKQDKEI